MRIVTYGAACSLDGFIAPPDGSMDWLHFSRDVQNVMSTYWASIDTMLMGRKTWEQAKSFEQVPFAGKKVFVLARSGAETVVGRIQFGVDVVALQ